MTTPRSDVIVQVTDLTKNYGRLAAVRNVSFSIRPGEILGLIGPNGSGKTTVFECLGGVLPFESGSIEPRVAGGTPVMFYLPDAITPWPDQSVEWALAFAAGYFGGAWPRSELIERLGLRALLRQPMRALSKGQRKRTLLAIGLLTPHPILLADEPFDGLDLRLTRDVAQLLREVAASGRTLFLSIHQIADAERVCDRFVLLSGGRVRGEGTLRELAADAGRSASDARDSLEDLFLALV